MDIVNKQPRNKRPSTPRSGSGHTKKSGFKLDRLKRKPVILTALAVLAVLAALIAGFRFYASYHSVEPDSINAIEQAAMHFDPLMPESFDHDNPDFRFDSSRGVFSFNDLRNDISLTLSQQSAPESVKSDPEELLNVARQIQAESTIETNKGTVYIASNEGSANQTALFATDELLVFIHSDQTLTFEEWQNYINELTPR